MTPRRRLALVAACLPLAAPALAQGRPIRLIVAFPPGGSTDVLARLVAPVLERMLGMAILVDNRGGANGAVGMGLAAQASPDGGTFVLDAGGAATNPHLLRGLSFDYRTAFAPVTQMTILPALLVVGGEAPMRDFASFLTHVRANPGRESYGSSGVGTGSHLASALLVRRAGLRATHVPFRGGADQLVALRRGDTLFTFSTIATIAGGIRDGVIRPLAAATPDRAAAFPAVPTVAESGFPGFGVFDFHALYAPAGTPEEPIRLMAEAAIAAMRSEDLHDRFLALGLEPAASGPRALAEFLESQRQRMGALIREENIGLDG